MPEREEGGPEGDDDEDDDEDEGGFGEQMGLPEVRAYHTHCCYPRLKVFLCETLSYPSIVKTAFWHAVRCIMLTVDNNVLY